MVWVKYSLFEVLDLLGMPEQDPKGPSTKTRSILRPSHHQHALSGSPKASLFLYLDPLDKCF